MKKILVIEDTKEIREEICDILKMENFDVFEAENGLEGLKSSKLNLPHLIISDISMPMLDGYGLLLELKKNVNTENIPFIFLSAKSGLKDIRDGMNLGADDYLTKPLSPEDLIKAVNQKLELRSKIENKLNLFKSQIVQFLPHELITPLNGILGLSEYLKDSASNSNDEIYTIANGINNCGERLYRLIENYLIFSNLVIESDNLVINPKIEDNEKIETAVIIEQIVAKVASKRFNDLILNIRTAEFVYNKFFFTKMVEELISNAIKFSFTGSKIIVNSYITDNKYQLQVENEGIGISNEQINEISAFTQFNREINEQQGLGMGLEIVKLIVARIGGSLTIESKPDEFFKVTVQFDIL